MRSSTAYLASLAVVLAAQVSFAQTAVTPTARRAQLIDQAFEASTRGNHSEAIRLADEAAQIQVTPSLMMFLAERHEQLSHAPEGEQHMVDAVSRAAACVRGATEQTTLNNRVTLLQRCGAIVDQLSPRVARVRLAVPRPTPVGMRVRVNGVDVPEREWNDPVVVLPGAVAIEASAPERGEFHRALTLTAGRVESVEVTLPIDLRTNTQNSSGTTVLRVVGFSLLGVGAVAAAFGVVQWVSSNAQAQDALNGRGDQGLAWARYNAEINPRQTLSSSEVCSRAASDAANNADASVASNLCDANSTTRTTALALGIGGGVLAAAGATLAILSYSTGARRTSRVDIAPVLGVGVAGASLQVRF